MKLFTKTKLLVAVGVIAAATPLLSYVLFSGAPRWPLSGGFHYVADLNTTSFPAASVWDNNAQWSLSDWRDMGGTAFTPGFTRTNSDFNDHGNGRSSWVWLNRPADGWLGVTFVRWSGSTLTDCDIWYNSRPDYTWATSIFDPCAYRSYWPIDFRNVARHETGHAIGFDHEDRTLANMNAISQHGAGVQHVQTSGMLPHADEKNGCRALYPGSGTHTNVMSTNWRKASTDGSAVQETELTGSWAAGTSRSIAFWLANQSNHTVPGFGNGIRTGVYLSTNTIISAADTRIYETTYSGDWPAHAAGRYTPSVFIPANHPAGTFYVGVYFDNTGLNAEQWETDNTCVLGQITVTNTARTLQVRSRNPASGVNITVTPTDNSGSGSGATPFNRTYWNTEVVTLTAPTAVGFNSFRYWLLNGVIQRTNPINVTMDGTETAEAVYWNNVPGSVSNFGPPGCRGTNGLVPVHTITHGNGAQGPQQGTPTKYALSRARPAALVALYFGLRTDVFGSFRLPLDLGPILGMNGCWLSHDILVGLTLGPTTAAGTWSENVVFPVNSSSVGAHVYSTYAVVDFGVNAANVVHSNSLDLVIGGDT